MLQALQFVYKMRKGKDVNLRDFVTHALRLLFEEELIRGTKVWSIIKVSIVKWKSWDEAREEVMRNIRRQLLIEMDEQTVKGGEQESRANVEP